MHTHDKFEPRGKKLDCGVAAHRRPGEGGAQLSKTNVMSALGCYSRRSRVKSYDTELARVDTHLCYGRQAPPRSRPTGNRTQYFITLLPNKATSIRGCS